MEAVEKAMGYDTLRVNSPYPLLSIDDLQIISQVNHHSKLVCTGLVDSEQAEKAVENTGPHEMVEAVRLLDDGTAKTIFNGMITEVGLKTVRGNYYITIEALSCTFDLDVKRESASFQNAGSTYNQLIQKVLADFSGADCNDQVTKSAALGELVVRYQETAWEFLKRIASRFGAVLVPDPTQSAPKFWMGLPPGKERSIEDFHFTVVKNLDQYQNAAANYDFGLNETDFIGYDVESVSYLNIGDYVCFQKKNLRVAAATAFMKQGILTFRYILTLDTGIHQNLILNEKLSGAAIEGKIIDRAKDMVKVHLAIDQTQKKEEACFLPYSSFYTAEGNSGWYCMPELGDSVRVYFANARETSALVMSSVRKDGVNNQKTADPNTKYFGNTSGKELMLADGGVTLTASSKACELYLNLDTDKGIEVHSDRELNLESAKDITLNSEQSVAIKAQDGIYLHCQSSSIILDGKTDIQASRLTFQATGPRVKEKVKKEATQEKEESKWNILDVTQLVLDGLGFIPVVGAVFDLANAGIYAARGDYTSAALSAVAAVPGIGDCAAVAKIGIKAVKAAKTMGAVSKISKVAHAGMAAYGLAGAAGGLGAAYDEFKEGDYVNGLRDALPAVVMAFSLGKSLTKSRRLRSGIIDPDPPKRAAKSGKRTKRTRNKNRNKKLKTAKCDPKRGEPVDAVTGEVVVDQHDFLIAGRIPIAWERHYGSQESRVGACGRGWESFADIRLDLKDDGEVVFYDGSDAPSFFGKLPDTRAVMEPIDGGLLQKEENYYTVRLKEGLTYYFPIPAAPTGEIPVESIQDACGNSLRFIRDHEGLQEIREEGSGRSLKVTSKAGRIERICLTKMYRNQMLLARYEYDANGNLTAVYDGMDQAYRFRYQGSLLVRHTDRNQLSFYYEYDKYKAGGKCIHSWGDGGLYDYKFVYREAERITEITDSLGQVSQLVYDDRFLITQETDALGGITVYEYDDAGRTTAVVDPEGRRTEYAYDKRGNLLKLLRPDGQSIVREYQADRPVKVTDPNGAVWKQEWDERGLLARQISPMGAETRYVYDRHGQPVVCTDPLGAETKLAFDQQGNLTALTDSLGQTTRFAYDLRGAVTSRIDPMGRETEYRYDEKGRLIRAFLPGKKKIVCEYDGEDNLVYYEDEKGAVTELEYCGLNELKRRIQPGGQTVEYHYDTEERLIAITNQRGERYELKRDALGRIISEADYWGQERQYVYSPAGNLLESIDPLDRKIGYRTDPLGRIIEKRLPDPSAPEKPRKETFSYDANGNLTGCENETIKITRSFDLEGRLLEERQGKEFILRNAYDKNGNRISRTSEVKAGDTPWTQTVNYGYDALGQTVSMAIPGHDPVRLTRDGLGQVIREQLSPNLKRLFDYSSEGFLVRQSVLNNEGRLFNQEYQYDLTGNQVQKVDSVWGTEQYQYDPLGRIVVHIDPDYQVKQFLYDPAGDLLKTQVKPENEEWSREGEYDGVRYWFDRVGNLIERSGAKEQTEFVWDAGGRLVESIKDGVKTVYAYDPLGRRVSKETHGVSFKFFWDGDALLGDNVANINREWVYYPGSFEPLAMVGKEQLYLYHNDPNGCPNRLMDPDGKVVWAARFDAWGRIRKSVTDEVDQPLRLQGQYFDGETGLHYNRYRYYCPETGSFVSQDPLGLAAGENVYGFGANTLGWIDPLGLSCKKPQKPIVLGETMSRRVEPVAQKLGAHTFNPRSENPARWKPNQKRWIRKQIKSGRDIYDIGTDRLRPSRSEYYGIERSELIKAGYRREYQQMISTDVSGTTKHFRLYKWVK